MSELLRTRRARERLVIAGIVAALLVVLFVVGVTTGNWAPLLGIGIGGVLVGAIALVSDWVERGEY